MAKPALDKALKTFQGGVRTDRAGDYPAMTYMIPDDLAREDAKVLTLSPGSARAFREALAEIETDLRLEYLTENAAKDALLRFASLCAIDRSKNHVAAFLAEHAREVESRTCIVPIDHVRVTGEMQVAGMTLVPTSDPRIEEPLKKLPPGMRERSPDGSVALVAVNGTSLQRMAERARAEIDQELRVLRVALHAERSIPDLQLRFARGDWYAFDDGAFGWTAPEGSAVAIDLSADLLEHVARQPVTELAAGVVSKFERQAELAVEAWDRAEDEPNPNVALQHLFTALESILGDESAGLKAPLVAFRRAMLSVATRGHFGDPHLTYELYDAYRSPGVHGEDAPVVSHREVVVLQADVRDAINEYLEYGRANDCRRRSGVLRLLDEHPEEADLRDWLRENGDPGVWQTYLGSDEPDLDSRVTSGVDDIPRRTCCWGALLGGVAIGAASSAVVRRRLSARPGQRSEWS